MELTARHGTDVAALVLACARRTAGTAGIAGIAGTAGAADAGGAVDVALAAPPEPVTAGYGRHAYACRLAGDPVPPWPTAVIARVAPAADVQRERDWHELCATHACPVPPVLGLAGTDDPEGDGPAAIVLDPGPRQSLLERLGERPIAIPDLLRAMAGLHARVHGVPVAAAPRSPDPDGAAGPLAALDRALGAAAGLADRFAAQRAWLGAHVPESGAPVVCHGDLQPASVRLDGGDPASAQVVNWSRARVADAEYDMALTLLVFWSVPYLAEGMGQRKLLKTVRDMLTDGYRTAYEAARGVALDEGRLRYWGAYHAVDWSVRLATAEAAGGPADPWDPVALVHHPGLYRRDLARRVARLTRG
ncbi:MAG TPA: aminoglycoside phosphotransferase family protein [Acidimicrobiales bacterium]